MAKKYGKKIKILINEGDPVAKNALEHQVASEEYTLGEASHEDIEYGAADPRVEAAQKALGDETARGGKGPVRKG